MHFNVDTKCTKPLCPYSSHSVSNKRNSQEFQNFCMLSLPQITKSMIPTTRNSSASKRVGCPTSSEKPLQLRKDSKETNYHTTRWSQSAPWFCWNHSLLTLYYKKYTQKGWDLGVATSPIRSAISRLLVMLLINWWFVTTQKRGNMLGKRSSLIPFVTKLEKVYNFRYCF